VASGLYGAYRVIAFHPAYSKRYSLFLALTPWSIDKPMPKGPVHIIWVDIVVIAVLTFLCYQNSTIQSIWPTVIFFGSYLICLFFTFNKEQSLQRMSIFVFTPFVVFPHRSPYYAAILLLVFYVIFYFGLRNYHKNFPWNTDFWKYDQTKTLLKQALTQRVIGWPHRQLKCFDPEFEFTFVSSLVCSLIITWWLHVIIWFIDEPIGLAFLFVISYFLFIFRLTIYLSHGHLPPINFWGRLFTFRWIIPGYDTIFLGPICVLLVCFGTVVNGFLIGLNFIWIFDIAVFLMFLVAFLMPPTLKEWRLTGKSRIFQNKKLKQRPPASRGLVTDNLLDKFRQEY
jgi:hypothetical protein